MYTIEAASLSECLAPCLRVDFLREPHVTFKLRGKAKGVHMVSDTQRNPAYVNLGGNLVS
jgi:hypothetical protein